MMDLCDFMIVNDMFLCYMMEYLRSGPTGMFGGAHFKTTVCQTFKTTVCQTLKLWSVMIAQSQHSHLTACSHKLRCR